MLYIIKIDQVSLAKWKKKIDPTDSLIITYIYEMVKSKNKNIHRDQCGYVWVDHKSLLKNMPLLNITERTLSRRLMKLEKIGLLERRKKMTFYGSRGMYRFTNIEDIYGAASAQYHDGYYGFQYYEEEEGEEEESYA